MTSVTTLTELRAQRAEAEGLFLRALNGIKPDSPDVMRLCAEAQGYHREVCAAYAAELSLISSGKLPDTTNTQTTNP